MNLSIGEKGLPVLEVASRSRDQDNDDEEGESSSVEQVTTVQRRIVQFEREHFEFDNMAVKFFKFFVLGEALNCFGGKIAILEIPKVFFTFFDLQVDYYN